MKKIICLALMAVLFIGVNSCHDDEIRQDENLALKSGDIKKKDTVADFKLWFENNPDLNTFELTKRADEISWQNALVMEINDTVVVEVNFKLNKKFKVKVENNPKLNVEHRLLFIKEKGHISSYIEYFISKEDMAYLHDFEKVNYKKRKENFKGTIILENSKKETKVFHYSEKVDECNEVKLKSATEMQIECIGLYEDFDDGSSTLMYIIRCTYFDDSSPVVGETGGGPLSPTPTTPQPCNCPDVCTICGKCLISTLKSVPIPGDGTTTTQTTDPCMYCAGHPVPEPVIVIDSLIKYPCAYDVYNSFGNFNNFISSTLQNTFGSSHTFNVTFIGAALSSNTDGECDGNAYGLNPDGTIAGGNFTISVNNYILNNSTKEYIAVIYAHETIHALIRYYNANDPEKGKELFPIFYEWPSSEGGDHLTMANRYVDQMANVVLQINPNMPTLDAKCLAWNGLQGTRVYDLQRSNYNQINGSGAWEAKMAEVNQRERNGTSTIGTKCPPKTP